MTAPLTVYSLPSTGLALGQDDLEAQSSSAAETARSTTSEFDQLNLEYHRRALPGLLGENVDYIFLWNELADVLGIDGPDTNPERWVFA